MTVVDDHGTSVTIAQQPTHLVSLAPSATEIIYAVGRGDALVAGDQYDDYPPQAKAKAVIKGLKPSLEAVVAYSPDLVLATSSNDQQLVDQLRATKVPVLMLDPNDFSGVYKDIALVGKALNSQVAAQQVIAGMQEKVQQVEDKTAHVVSRPRVFDEIDATDPTKPFTAGPGSFIDAMITEAGGTNVAHDAKTEYPQFSLESLLAANPQIIILQDSAYGVSAASVAQRTGWSTLAAVQEHHIYGIDDSLVSRAGPRLADGLVALAKIIHPELFP